MTETIQLMETLRGALARATRALIATEEIHMPLGKRQMFTVAIEFGNNALGEYDLWQKRKLTDTTEAVRTGSQAQVIADILEHGTGTYLVDESVEYESEEDVFVGVQRIQALEPEIQPDPTG